ncbi:unnamed protein product, partial [Polarella glacialis]
VTHQFQGAGCLQCARPLPLPTGQAPLAPMDGLWRIAPHLLDLIVPGSSKLIISGVTVTNSGGRAGKLLCIANGDEVELTLQGEPVVLQGDTLHIGEIEYSRCQVGRPKSGGSCLAKSSFRNLGGESQEPVAMRQGQVSRKASSASSASLDFSRNSVDSLVRATPKLHSIAVQTEIWRPEGNWAQNPQCCQYCAGIGPLNARALNMG